MATERRFPDRQTVTEVQARYDKENTVQFKLKLHKVNDADIIEKLNSVDNKQGYIKRLIREDAK